MRKTGSSISVGGWDVERYNQTSLPLRRHGRIWFRFRHASSRGEACAAALHAYVPADVLKAAQARWPGDLPTAGELPRF